MKKDTVIRIEEYKNRLPRLKERVVAAVSLLLVSVIMLTTASLAWITMSVNPEVSDISTSIAANGNLEIALASGTLSGLTIPGATQIGDGNLPIVSGNLTWGNLINLSDPSYGLSNIVLRPAGLNKDGLLGSPLYGAAYDESGKHNSYINSFRYGTWQSSDPANPDAPWEFAISDELGVRAILSTKMSETVGFAYGYAVKRGEAEAALAEAREAYLSVTKNIDIVDGNKEKQFLESLAAVMGAYMTARMNPDEPSLQTVAMEKAHMEAFRDLFRAFLKVLELEQEAMRKLANLHLYVLYQGGEDYPYDELDMDEFLELYYEDNLQVTVTNANGTSNVTLRVTGLRENLEAYEKMQENYEKLVNMCDNDGEIKWGTELNNIVNAFVNVGNCRVEHKNYTGNVSGIGAGIAYNLNKETCKTIITNGVLYDFEKRVGGQGMDVPNGTTALQQKYPNGLPVKATGKRMGLTMNGTIYALITTSASGSVFQSDLNYIDIQRAEIGGAVQLSANDTYGFAIDFWVRTNASGSFLVLEGNVITETITKEVMGTDAEGNQVKLYVYTVTTTDNAGEEITLSEDVYQKNGKWYYNGTDTECEIDVSNPPKEKVEIVENVIGYEGENRVWDDNAFLSTDSTTQGSGSCYVYYTETPEDMERSLKLLSAMKIAFVDVEGNLLAEGYMDTKNYFLDNGKVTVPMRLDANSITLTNSDGSETLAITPLEKNVAKLITAIVYLDGTKVENQDVLAVSEIQGQMNIQFGSSAELNSVQDENLASQYMSISASTEISEFNYDTSVELGRPMTTKVMVDIDGTTPQRVSAYFVRKISNTQAIPLNGAGQVMNFTDVNGDGVWEAEYTFNSPGTYVIRSIFADGVEYDLEPSERPEVVVEGFSVRYLMWGSTTANTKEFMTAASSVSDSIILEFVTSEVEAMPTKVEGRFIRTDGNSVNVTFKRDTDNVRWTGDVTFLSSGEYTLQYLVFNGEYYPVESSMQREAKVYLGMKAAVYTNSPNNFVFGYGVDRDPSNGMAENEENLYMQIKIVDDIGNEMKGLSNVKLYYSLAGYTTEVNGLDADMEWNASTGYYEGEFRTKAGVFQFLYVTVGDNVIKTATTAPQFTIQSPLAPSFVSGRTEEWQYVPDASRFAKIIVQLENTEGIPDSSVTGVLVNGSVEERVAGMNLGDGKWQFAVPHREGVWTLTGIEFVNIYYEGVQYGEDNPFVLDLAGESGVTTTVLTAINVGMSKNEDISFSGVFLQEHDFNALNSKWSANVTIMDNAGNPLPEINQTIVLIYTYDGNSQTYGGYTFDHPTWNKTVTITMTQNPNNPTEFVLSSIDSSLKYAGSYTLTSISFTFKGGAITLEGNNNLPVAGKIIVESSEPVVSVSAISDYTGSSKETYKATVKWGSTYNSCTQNYTYEQPYVTLSISNMGNASKATLTFTKSGGTVLLFAKEKSGDPISTYEWSKGTTTCQRWVGQYTSGILGGIGDSMTVAGTITADALTMTDSAGVIYTFTLDNPITISNPS